jgi:tRNA(Ile)-lysidine synthase TilS/MesJ
MIKQKFFEGVDSLTILISGGLDSAVLLYAAAAQGVKSHYYTSIMVNHSVSMKEAL